MLKLGAVEQRWVTQLSDYHIYLHPKPGAEHQNVNALSRLPEATVTSAVEAMGPVREKPEEKL